MTLTLLGLFGRSQSTPLVWIILIIMGLAYLTIIWIPLGWWTRLKYTLAALGVNLLVFSLFVLTQGRNEFPANLLLVPLILLLGREQHQYRWFLVGLAATCLVVLAALAPTQEFVWSVVPVVAAMYMSIRAINIYKDAYRMSQENMAAVRAAHQELQQTYTALQEATGYSVRYAALSERARLAREIHDGLGHQLTSLIVQLQALQVMLPGDPERAARAIPDMLAVSRKAMAEVRQAIETWREDDVSLSALQSLISQTSAIAPFQLVFQPRGDISNWTEDVSVALYRILQEALTNILRHSKATAATVEVWEVDRQVNLTVSDDGCYTESKPLLPGYGIKGILERAQALGGDCQFLQNQPHGLKLKVTIPFQPNRRHLHD